MNPHTYKRRKTKKQLEELQGLGFVNKLLNTEVHFVTVLAFIFFAFGALIVTIIMQAQDIGEGYNDIIVRKQPDASVLGASTVPIERNE